MEDFDTEIKSAFLEEAQEGLEAVEQYLLDLSSSGMTEEILSNLFRLFHNLKGSAQAVGFVELGNFTHKIESLLSAVRSGDLSESVLLTDTLLAATDLVRNHLIELKQSPDAPMDSQMILDQVSMLLSTKQTSADPEEEISLEAVETTLDELEELEDIAEEPILNVTTSKTPEPTAKLVKPKESSVPGGGDSSSKQKKSIYQAETIKIKLDRLDGLLNAIGELVIYQNIVNQTRKPLYGPEFKQLNDSISKLNIITKEIQDKSLSLRMLPIRSAFNRMKRIAHDCSRQTDKNIDFVVSGDHIELDKTVLDAIVEPLTHLVRNAVDHGIESAEQRKETGKSEKACVRLSARQDIDKVVIELSDDGGGISAEHIFQKAVEKGMVQKDLQLSENQVLELIFRNGFSTADSVTELSGRGVGMNVVKETIQGLNGEIHISSTPGSGTTFTIELPLSMAIINGILCEIRGDFFIVPLSALTETLQVEKTQIGAVNQKGYSVRIRKEELPYFDLEHVLANKRTAVDPEQERMNVLVSTINSKKYAFRVDRFLNIQQFVVKKVGLEFRSVPGYAGSTVLGDGTAGLILDLQSIIESKLERHAA